MVLKNINWLVILFVGTILYGCASQKANVKEYTAEDIKPITVSEFTLGPSDVIDVQVWRNNELSRKVQVDPYGKITYPFIGEINVMGMSVSQLRDVIKQGISKYFVDPVIEVNVSAVQSQKVFVLGEVSRPGIFALSKPTDILEAIALSGGFTQDAREENVLLIRGDKNNPDLIKLDLKSAMKYADLKQNIRLQSGDIVYVPVTFIADTARYFQHLKEILFPMLLLEQGIILGPQVGDVFSGKDGKTSSGVDIIIQKP
jgi:polysaccharide export outer membrane protein